MVTDILKQAEDKMKKTVEAFRQDLVTIRAGKASASLLDRVYADYYGSPTPLNQLAGISVPEPRLIVITPYDKSSIKAIEKAILTSDLGLNPNNDGQVIRLTLPPMTEERRRELVRVVGKKAEDARVIVRNHRRDLNEQIKGQEKQGLPEDESRKAQDEAQKLTDKYIQEIDAVAANKEKEIMEV